MCIRDSLCYVFAYLDRINIGFAKLQMQQDIGISDAVYGLGAGIFFLGYVMFEVPSNLLLTRIGARRTISRIMVLWGLTSASMLFVQGEWSFYVLRFMLGVFEAGFAPGMIFYLTYWYSQSRMAGVLSLIHIFYERCGFQIDGLLKEEFFSNGTYRDAYRMALRQHDHLRDVGPGAPDAPVLRDWPQEEQTG